MPDDNEVRALNPVALVALQGVLFLVLLKALFALGASTVTALVVAWLGSVPALLGVLVAVTGNLQSKPSRRSRASD